MKLILLVMLLLATMALAVAFGSTPISWGNFSDADRTILWSMRMPRVVAAAIVGAALGMAGAQMQGVFRNPLAEPGLLGVGAGAALGGVLAISFGWSGVLLQVCAFGGALLALAIVYGLAAKGGEAPAAMLLLAGVAVGSLFGAAVSLLIALRAANWQVTQEILFWTMGGLEARTWLHVRLALPFILLGGAVGWKYSRELDVLSQGEEAAAALGVEVEKTRREVLVSSAILTGSAVAVAGMVGFVGLVTPHIARLLFGPAHRTLLPMSALLGAVFLVLADLAARSVRPPLELRLGMVTAAVGAPYFLWLLRTRWRA